MNIIISLFLILVLSLFTPVQAIPQMGAYTVVITCQDLKSYFSHNPKYEKDLYWVMEDWDELDKCLEKAAKDSGKEIIFLDFMVHGNYKGLYLNKRDHDDKVIKSDRASVGYILNRVKKHLLGRKAVICFESCLSAGAYRNTIRGAVKTSHTDNIEDYNGIPLFPVWGIGDGFSSFGPIMYIQHRYNFKKWWVDLRDYDKLGSNQKLVKEEEDYFEGMGPMSENIYWLWEVFSNHIP